jgi:hypothetical protein
VITKSHIDQSSACGCGLVCACVLVDLNDAQRHTQFTLKQHVDVLTKCDGAGDIDQEHRQLGPEVRESFIHLIRQH